MSKKQITYVDAVQFENLIKAHGLTMKAQASFIRVEDPTNSNRRIYVAKTKQVGRVDISGYEPKAPGVLPLTADQAKAERLGAVRGQLDFSLPAEEVLKNFDGVLRELVGQAPMPAPEATETQAAAQ